MTQTGAHKTLIEIFETATIDNGDGTTSSLFKQNKTTKEFTNISYPFKPLDITKQKDIWFEIKFLDAQPRMIEQGQHSMNNWKGIMQINICVYKSVTDIDSYMETAYAAIAEVMKRGVIKDRVHITGCGESSALDNGNYYFVPINVSWYANLAN